MKPVRISSDIVPIAEFKGHAAHWLKRVNESGQPLVITQNGKPAGVLLSPAEFDRIAERHAFLESIATGIADADAGRTIDSTEVRRRIQRRSSKT